MAVFDPNPQEVGEQDFRNYTKPISVTPTNKSTGIALEGAGKALDEGGQLLKDTVKLDDYLTKEDARNTTYNTLDPVRDQQIASNYDTLKSLGAPANLLPNKDDITNSVPTNLADATQKFQSIAEGMKSNKLPDLYYRAQINTLTKSLRSQYPGYRDYIDQQVSKAGFGNPANELINAQNAAIGQIKSQLGDPVKDALKFINEHDKLDGATEYRAAIMSGDTKAIQNMYSDFGRQLNHDYHIDQRMKEINYQEAERKVDAYTVGQLVDDQVSGLASNIAATDRSNSGTSTLQEAQTWVDHVKNNPDDPEIGIKAPAYVAKLDAQINDIKARTNAWATQKQVLKDGSSWRYVDRIGGPEALNQRVNNNETLQLLQSVRNSIAGKDWDAAHIAANQVQAQTNAFNKEVFSDRTVGRTMQAMDFINRHGGTEAGKEYLTRLLGDSAKTKTLTDNFQAIVNRTSLESTLPNADPVKPVIKNINDSKSVGPQAKGDLTNAIFADVQKVTDEKIPADMRANKVNAFFNAYNTGMLDLVKVDSTNAYGQPVKGRYSVYADFARPEMVQAIKKLGGDAWNNYQGFMKKEFTQSLFNKEINSLNDIKDLSPDLKVHWDTEDENFHLTYKGKELTGRNVNQIDIGGVPGMTNTAKYAATTLNRLNSGISSYANVLKDNGKPLDGQLVDAMKEAGYDPNHKYESLPGMLFESLKTGVKVGIQKLNESNAKNEDLVSKENERKRKVNRGEE